MPVLPAWVLGALAMIAGSLVSRVLVSLGIAVVSYVGIGLVFDYAIAQVVASFNGLPVKALQMAALMQFDVAANIIIGAVNARLGLLTLNGLVSRFQINPAAYAGSS